MSKNYTAHTQCLVCNSNRFTDLQGYEKHHLVQCRNCGFVFCDRIPTLNELNAHYALYSYGSQTLSPITIKRYHELLDRLEPYRRHNRLIDVGCGSGFFLEQAQKRGWEVYGTEFSPKAVEVCRAKGINMQQGVLDPKNYEGIEFDVITSFEVIEHINNPQQELGNMFGLLRKGGVLYCTTPNFNALARYYLKANYNVIEYPEHLSYYTPKTLARVMRQAGFAPKQIVTTGISINRLQQSSGQNNTVPAQTAPANKDEQLRQQIEGNKLLQLAKETTNGIFSLLGIGMAMKGFFEKP